MIINSSKVKSEALLLFCRDLIDSYKNSDDNIFNITEETKDFVNEQIEYLNKAINTTTQPIDYYTRNIKVSRISLIVKSYNFINNNISKLLNKGDKFNPTMLCFSLLSTWFAELSHGKSDKEFLYFCLYPYSEIYDKLLLNTNNLEYKNLNISMINIAENVVIKLDKYRFK